MKKNNILICIIVLVVILLILAITTVIINVNKNSTEGSQLENSSVSDDQNRIVISSLPEDVSDIKIDNPDEIIIEKAYKSYAWGFEYRGYLISKDGTIYHFSTQDSEIFGYNDNDDTEETLNIIKKISTKLDKKIDEEDMKIIIKYSKMIDFSTIKDDPKMMENDAGIKYIDLIINGKANRIYASGESYIRADDTYANRIIEIVNHYISY